MVVGWALHACAHGSLKCKLNGLNPFKLPEDKKELDDRKTYRRKILNIWLNSVSDDLDMITDWWFFLRQYEMYGLAWADGTYSRLTLFLLVFCGLGTISYLLELYQTVRRPDNPIKWLALFTILFEDVPQVVLTLLITKRFEGEQTPLSAFNIATSVYSALIKIGGPVFLDSCYCCVYEGSGVSSRNVEFSGSDYHEA